MEAVWADWSTWKIPGYTHMMHRAVKAKGKKPNATYWEATMDGSRIFLNTYTRDQGAKVYVGFWKGRNMISQLTLQSDWNTDEAKNMMKELAEKYSKKEITKDGLEAAKARWIGDRTVKAVRRRPSAAPRSKSKAKATKAPEEDAPPEDDGEAEEAEDGEEDVPPEEEDEDETEGQDDTEAEEAKENDSVMKKPVKQGCPSGSQTPPTTPRAKRPRSSPTQSPAMKRPAAAKEVEPEAKGVERIEKVPKNADLEPSPGGPPQEPPSTAQSGSRPSGSPVLKDMSLPPDAFDY